MDRCGVRVWSVRMVPIGGDWGLFLNPNQVFRRLLGACVAPKLHARSSVVSRGNSSIAAEVRHCSDRRNPHSCRKRGDLQIFDPLDSARSPGHGPLAKLGSDGLSATGPSPGHQGGPPGFGHVYAIGLEVPKIKS